MERNNSDNTNTTLKSSEWMHKKGLEIKQWMWGFSLVGCM